MTEYEAVFVDDDLALASSYANAVTASLQIRCFATNSPYEALAVVRAHPIRVAVLDQRMPELEGIELMTEIHAIDQMVQVIILSGEALDEEIIAAYDTGVTRFLKKNNWRNTLVLNVERGIVAYEVGLAEARRSVLASSPPIKTRHGFPWLGRVVEHRLLSMEVQDDQVIDSSWRTAGRIDAGVTTEIESVIEWKRVSERELKLDMASSGEFGLSAGQLAKVAGKIGETLSQSDRYRDTVEHRNSLTTRLRVALAAEPEDPNQLHVVSRSFEIAPVFFLVKATIVSRCGNCCALRHSKLQFLVPKTRYATRRIDYRSDGTEDVKATGIHTP